MKQIEGFLRKNYFWILVVTGAWNLLFMNILMGGINGSHILFGELPSVWYYSLWLVFSAVGVTLEWLRRTRNAETLFYILSFGWNFGSPIVGGVGTLLFFDTIHDFSGRFFGGLEALAYTIWVMLILGIAVPGGILSLLKRKFHWCLIRGEKSNNVLNNLFLVITILVLIGFCWDGGIDLVSDSREKALLKQAKAFEESFYGRHGELDESELLSMGYTGAYTVELLVLGEEIALENEVSPNLMKGCEKFQSLLSNLELERGVEYINAYVIFDPKEKRVKLCYPVQMLNREKNAYEEYYAVLSYDEQLNLQDVDYLIGRKVDDLLWDYCDR